MPPDDPFQPSYVAIGANIASIRRSQGLTQEDVAGRSDLHPVMVSRLERGATNPRISTLLRVAQALDANLAMLVSDVPVPPVRR